MAIENGLGDQKLNRFGNFALTPIAHPSPWSSIYGLYCREIPADEDIHEFLTRIPTAIQKADFRSPTTSSDSTHARETGASNLEAFRSVLRLMRKRERRPITFVQDKVGRTTAHAARDTCCSKVDADMVSCVRRISARESKKASVDSAP